MSLLSLALNLFWEILDITDRNELVDKITKSKYFDLFLQHRDNQAESAPHAAGLTKFHFNEQFVDKTGLKRRFEKAIDEICTLFTMDALRTTYLSPYIAVVQSSGVGKSRTSYEYAKLHHSFYICCRDDSSSGYPPRSPIIADLLMPNFANMHNFDNRIDNRANFCTSYYVLLINACLRHLLEHCNCSPESWIDRQIQKKVEQGTGTTEEVTREDVADFWASVNEEMIKESSDSLGKMSGEPLLDKCKAKLNQTCEDLKKRNISYPILFIFDEANTLLNVITATKQTATPRSFFHYLRLALHFLPRDVNIKIGAVFLDTFGNVANYVPITLPDPSLRTITARVLFPPFYHFERQNHPLNIQPEDPNFIDERLRHTGRWLWAACKTAIDAIGLAQGKLLNKPDLSIEQLTQPQYLAVLGPRLALHFAAQEKLALDLVKSHCASLLYMSDDRSNVMIGYPSEPVLAVAACDLTVKKDLFKWENLLEPLTGYVLSGLVSDGVRGELVARILLLICMDSFKNTGDPTHCVPVKVSSFLEKLFGLDEARLKSVLMGTMSNTCAETFLNGHVNFNHWVYIFYSPTKDDLEVFYHRFGAMFCMLGQEGYDLVIPVYLGKGQYTMILVEVRNRKSGLGLKDVNLDAYESMRYDAKTPFVYLLLQFNKGDDSVAKSLTYVRRDVYQKLVIEEPPEPNVDAQETVRRSTRIKAVRTTECWSYLYARGLNSDVFPFLTPAVQQHLKNLLSCWADPVKISKSPADMAALKNVLYPSYQE